MARKKPNTADPKARLELRFDQDLADEVKTLADTIGISVNQLIQGVMRWAIEHGHPGEPVEEGGPDHMIPTRPVPGTVWFGRSEDEPDRLLGPDDVEPGLRAYVAFMLDFTERRVVVDGKGVVKS